MPKLWRIKQADIPLDLAHSFNLSPLILRLLVIRGVDTGEKIQSFLHGSQSDLHQPMLLRDMDKAVARILQARERKERVLLYGDYDVDGVTSVVLLSKLFYELGLPFSYHHPDRVNEGYGFHLSGVEMAKAEGASLVITADCGITNHETVEAARAMGIDVIITDHHKVIGKIPDAVAVINPQREDCPYPYKHLAGVGVVLKLVQAIFQQLTPHPPLDEYLEIAALGTVVDVVPITGENRIITRLGLEVMDNQLNQGIVAIRKLAGLWGKNINCGHIGFQIGPRLNAAGRLSMARLATELLLASDEKKIAEIASLLEAENTRRRSLQEEMTEIAIREIEKHPEIHSGKVLVISGEGWHPGVIGLVASQLQETYYRPAIVIATEEGIGHGSARSIPEFHIFNVLQQLAPMLLKFGGHRQAAGLTIEGGRIGLFRQKINQIADELLAASDLVPKLDIDLAVDLTELNIHDVEQLDLLQPFGYGNPAPVLAAFGCRLKSAPRCFGQGGRHLKFRLSDALGRSFDCLGWNMANRIAECKVHSLDIAFRPYINEWNGQRSIQLEIKDFRPAGKERPLL
ncbi:MAG: single-stranded-DNA-specific exonuclease RecJ [bacterium]|nr:single-stranded-DNA-specific exonuclease RecJ [bacterium]